MNKTTEKYFNEENLKLAYYRVVCWPVRLVKDRYGINAFGANLDENCKNLVAKIRNRTYTPQKGSNIMNRNRLEYNDKFVKHMDLFMPKWRQYRDELNSIPVAPNNWGY
jgi:hypothetical protein